MTERVRFIKVKNDYKAYIAALVKTYPECWKEDLIQEGNIGLYYACLKFDPGKGIPFDAFAKPCIKNQIISAYRILGKDAGAHELTEEIPAKEKTDITSAMDIRNFFEELRKNLSDFENKVLDEYLLEKSYIDIANKLSVTEKSVNNAVLRIRKKIRKYYVE